VEGDFGTHPSHKQEDTFASVEAMKQLVELGYIEEPDEDKKTAVEKITMETQYNLSRVYASNKRYDKVLPILEELYQKNNEDIRYNLDLANCYLSLKRFDDARNIIEHLRKLDDKALPNIDLLEGILLTHENKPRKALEFLKKAEKSNPRLPGIHLELGRIYLQTRRYKDAEAAFLKALEIDDSSAAAYHGLAVSLLRNKRYEEAAEQALNAIGLIYHFPTAHYHLGEALYSMGRYKEATDAFEVCLTMAPQLNKARRWLVKIYTEKVDNKERIEFHNKILKEQMKGKIIIVSGLPRSGTSMMMQMLHAGGIDILTDEVREANEFNPKGYYEHELVKSLAKDKSWLDKAEGKAVKIIAQLLQFLPSNYDYKIIFMQRDMDEILQSQQKMLGKKEGTYPVAIAKAFEKELERVEIWAKKEPNVDILNVNYKEIIVNATDMAGKIDEFLKFQLDTEKMIEVVDPDLYRNKIEN